MPKTQISDVKSRLLLVQLGLIVAFIVVALTLVYWSVMRGSTILARADNPRQVDVELNTLRGRILDINGLTLAETRYVDGELIRQYASGATGPVVGYYSFRHGTAGIEDSFDQLLSGEQGDFWSEFWLNDVLHEQRQGQDIRLTLDSRWQKRAESLLNEEQGAATLFSLSDMGILSMTSNPGYDPNQFDEQFDSLANDESAPLLNRATQGQYQPGLLLQPFILASLASSEIIDLGSQLEGVDEVATVEGMELSCNVDPPDQLTWVDLIVYQCPVPLQDLARLLDAGTIATLFDQLGFLSALETPVENEFSNYPAVLSSELALIGQDELKVSPVQIAVAAGALANKGLLRQPEIVVEVQDQSGRWNPDPDGSTTEKRIFDDSAANLILSSLALEDGIREYSTLVPANVDEDSNAWYIGFAPAENPIYGVVIVLENKDDLAAVERIGRSLLSEVTANNE